MRHRKKKTTLDRESSHRKALLRNLATSLVLFERVHTTEAKAKALRPVVEKLISRAKTGSLADRRTLIQSFTTLGAVRKAIDVLGPRYKERKGGFVRIVHAGQRRGDAARTAFIELV